jgi:hypothetical protein
LKLKDFQDRFQRAILEGNDAILDSLTDGARETKVNLLQVYRDGYVLRLIDVVGNDHEHLRGYLGEPEFRAMASEYIAANPSQHPNARWFSRGLPEFLRTTEPYARTPVLAELAALERALNDAFERTTPRVGIADLAAIPAGACRACLDPPVGSASASTNAGAIWVALKAEESPPPAMSPSRCAFWSMARHDRDVAS